MPRPAARAAAGRAEREPQREGEREHRGRERGRRQREQPRRGPDREAEQRRRRERPCGRRRVPAADEGRERQPELAAVVRARATAPPRRWPPSPRTPRRAPRAAARQSCPRHRARRRSRAVTSGCHPRAMVRRALAAATLAGAALAAGCGSAPPSELPPAAEPASSPPATAPPAGRIVPVGNRPEGIAADPVTGRFAVGLRDPALLALVDGAGGAVERRVPLPAAPRHLQRDGGRVLVPAEDADALVRVRFADGEAAAGRRPAASRTTPPRPPAARSSPTSSRTGSPCCAATVRSGRSDRAAARRRHAGPGRARIAVVAVRGRVVEPFDAATGRRIGSAPAGVGPTHVVVRRRRLPLRDGHRRRRAARLPSAPRLELIRRYRCRARPTASRSTTGGIGCS